MEPPIVRQLAPASRLPEASHWVHHDEASHIYNTIGPRADLGGQTRYEPLPAPDRRSGAVVGWLEEPAVL